MDSDWVLFDIRNVCRITGLGRSRIYVELQAGRLRSIKVGSRRLIPRRAIDDWVADLIAKAEMTSGDWVQRAGVHGPRIER